MKHGIPSSEESYLCNGLRNAGGRRGERNADSSGDSSDDDDVKRVLRHIGGIGENAPDEDDFEKAMEEELNDAVRTLEKSRLPQPVPLQSPPTFSHSRYVDTATPQHASSSTASESSFAAADSSGGSIASKLKLNSGKKSVKFQEKPADFYDPAYFDSDDEEPESSLKPDGSRATKKHPVLSNDELFYDPKVDEEDQLWVDSERKKYQPKTRTAGSGDAPLTESPPKKKKEKAAATTDAVLNCPACMTAVCLDCQRHEVYHQQYRAMFVLNCCIDKTRSLICKAKKQPQKKRRTDDSEPDEFVTVDGTVPGSTDKSDIFFPVKCIECGTEVGVIDNDEVYHFFNVIASHPNFFCAIFPGHGRLLPHGHVMVTRRGPGGLSSLRELSSHDFSAVHLLNSAARLYYYLFHSRNTLYRQR
ncbi:putative E2F-associated phosphoprotein [Hypsibius exemplaris]|uniref:E2F-associated phosphoprotein n=1 Tax=Hypsibius exemplaris TaxID=2072580 RepID=A0A9X6NID4_HYPEX|nr:putative E2F-associated phosphoprotein [Hypsibius exemplaris]